MNAPTPREQELEAQNKALWELVEQAHEAMDKIYAWRVPLDVACTGFAFGHAFNEVYDARAAIQKAKESR